MRSMLMRSGSQLRHGATSLLCITTSIVRVVGGGYVGVEFRISASAEKCLMQLVEKNERKNERDKMETMGMRTAAVNSPVRHTGRS